MGRISTRKLQTDLSQDKIREVSGEDLGAGGHKSAGSGHGLDINVASSAKLICRTAVDSGDSNIEYVGEALPGTLTSASEWRILRVDSTSGTVTAYADGDIQFDNIWDNRESLSYS